MNMNSLSHTEQAETSLPRSPKRQKIFHHGGLSTRRHDDYTIAWVCALPIEMAAARAMLDETHESLPTHVDDYNTYLLGNIKQHNIVIACLPLEYGTNNAATVVTNLKRTFSAIRASLMVGVGGGVPSKADIRLGDVVVGTRVMQFDLGKIVPDGKFQRTAIPRTPHLLLGTAVSALRSKHELDPTQIPSIVQQKLEGHVKYGRPSSPDRLFEATYDHETSSTTSCDGCDHSRLVPRGRRMSYDVRIHYGAIASGNQVMKHGTTRDNVARELNVICFEMETAGLMDILPCLPIRGICDYSDSHKNKKWQRYAAATAAAYARELLEELPLTEAHTRVSYSSNQCLSQEYRQALLDSLSFKQIDSRKSTIESAHQKTCRWILSHPDYEAWLDPTKLTQYHGFLWISGKPGAGKSTIMKFAYSTMKSKACSKNATTASFFFNARGEYLEKSIMGMHRSLLLQLLVGYPDLQTVLDDPNLVSQSQTGCPSLNTLKGLFSNAVAALGQRSFTCFIDALDECDEQQVVDMVQYFEDLAEQSTAKGIPFRICFSSRHYPYINIRQGIQFTLEDQSGHAEDLAAYVASRLQIKNSALVEELRPQLLGKAAGVFMWVVLVVNILNKEYRRGGLSLRKRLAEIPTDLSDLFKDILRRDNENMEDLLLCILWILCAKRPLQPKEFYHALWSGLSLKNLVDSQIPDVTVPDNSEKLSRFSRYVISSSKGLAEITKSKQPVVQFIHESVRDFLIKDRGLQELWPDLGFDWESPSHDKLKQCCAFYMNHGLVRSSVSRLFSQSHLNMRTEISQVYPFLEYASQNILYHANAAANVIPQDEFLSSFPISNWININNVFENFKVRQYNWDASFFYVLADKGFAELIRTRLKKDQEIHVHGERYRYPLFAALVNSNKDAVAALLNLPSSHYDGVDITEGLSYGKDLKEHKYRTPLSWAAQEGQAGIVKLLLQTRTTVDEMDMGGRNPISRASEKGHEVVATLLIDREADVNSRDKSGRTPLLYASRNGHEAVIRLLIERGADVNAMSKYGRTPLQYVSMSGHEAVVRLFIDRGADINSRDKSGMTPLQYASMSGHEAVIRLLIERGQMSTL
ncbi:Pfs, NACHT and ankyrin domain protein [Talaromyces proteolyticus]|uniref:Pfs, NACHT and ankyrin domain protein n=1 Tax=Talaromyces proteolyticus TaxID=1131652 RepID=A0AAD4KIN3_9EURO|nr:Pfs, NACHT and ankyrin domain protein [Talaromyces proteolyticus]KAH8689171.1 Pfs, NACHT and ankyrin domain protein [Talaromyces proteolyticus]